MEAPLSSLILLMPVLLDSLIGHTEAQGKLPRAELALSRSVVSINDSVILTCRGPNSSLAGACVFATLARGRVGGAGCQRRVAGAELLRGGRSAHNRITLRCFYSLGEGPSPHSRPSVLTVLDLRKPGISVTTNRTEARIHCQAPPGIDGPSFFLYYNGRRTPAMVTKVGKGKREAVFIVSYSPNSTQTYCCRYQFKRVISELSDRAEVRSKDRGGGAEDQKMARFLWRHLLSALVLLAAIGLLIEHFISQTPTTDDPGRKRRDWESTREVVETAC